MKKTLILLSSLLVLFSCAKESAIADREAAGENSSSVPGQSLTIHASIPEGGLTKVSMEQDALNPDGAIKLAWEAEDVLTVTDASEPVNSVTFTLQSGAGEKDATFTGTTPSGWTGPFKVSYNSAGKSYNYSIQTQAADGSTEHLKYVATLSGVTDLEHFAFSKAWADENSATLSSSSVLRIRVQMPDGVAAKVKSMTLKTPVAPGDAMVLNLTTPSDADADGILNLYLTIPAGDIALPEGTPVALVFDTEDSDSFVRIHKFTAESSILSGRVNALKFNCKSLVNSGSECVIPGDGSSAYPYLVGDKFQLSAVALLLADDVVTSIKMVDDVDMKDVPWTHLNTGSGYKQIVDFDGNNKTISNLSKDMFYVFKGSIKDLTLDRSSVTSRGIFAEYCQGTGNSITNVNITNGKVNSSSSNVGALIGNINSGAETCATITNCTVSNTVVKGSGVVGGLIGFADAKVIISGCTFTGGEVTGSARYVAGLVSSAGNYDSVISDCHVENATITSSSDRAGGFAGQVQTKVQVKGCTVGTSLQKVMFNSTRTDAVANVGGFVGVNYGRITQNGDVRNKAYVKITSSNTTTGNSMQIGGFAGYNTGTIEYSDADVDMSNLKGQYIGGFCGILLQSGKIENSTETGSVTGNNYTGGFVGVIDSATTSISDCSSAGSVSAASSIGGFAGGCTAKDKAGTFTRNSSSTNVTSSGSNFGGFIGNCVGTFTSNCATGNVASTGGGNGGGFAGGIWEGSTGSVFSKNYATGTVSGNANLGGLIGYIGGNLTMSNCYATGNIGNSSKYNQKYGGLVGFTSDNSKNITEGVTITNCYAAGDVEPSFAGGGLIGRIGLASTSVSNCAAWNSKVSPHLTSSENWSSGAVVGVTFPTCTLTDNYRNPSMDLTAYWVPADMSTFQHANVSSTHPLTDRNGNEMTDTSTASGQSHYPQYPYHGKVDAGKTLSQLASTTLGWSSDVWDFGDNLPTLK